MALRSTLLELRSSKNTSASSINTTAPHEEAKPNVLVSALSSAEGSVPRSPAPTTYNGLRRSAVYFVKTSFNQVKIRTYGHWSPRP